MRVATDQNLAERSSFENLHQLENVMPHHANNRDIIPSDPFASEALVDSAMFVPEVVSAPTASLGSAAPSELTEKEESKISNDENARAKVNRLQDQQEEIFEDIVANTNPMLAFLPNVRQLAESNLYINHSLSYFSVKRSLLEDPLPVPRRNLLINSRIQI